MCAARDGCEWNRARIYSDQQPPAEFSRIVRTVLAVGPLAEASHTQILRLRFAGLRVPASLYVARACGLATTASLIYTSMSLNVRIVA